LETAGTVERIERLRVHESGGIEIRFSWWKDGKTFMPHPLDLPEAELLPLIKEAIAKGVFSDKFIADLRDILDEAMRRQHNT